MPKFSTTMLVGLWLAVGTRHLAPQEAKDRIRWPEGKRVAVSFSFDDARASQIDTGLALFDKHGVKVTFYVSPRNLEKRLDGWKRAAAGGHEIGNHTISHPCTVNYAFSSKNALEDYTLRKMEAELDGANAEIQRLLGVKAVTFAYPCGQKFVGRGENTASYVPLVAARFLTGRGYRDEGANDPAACDLAQVLGMESDALSFEQMRSLADAAAAQNGWLVFAGHEIGEPGRQTTQAADLDRFLRYARDPASGIWVDTVAAVAKHIRAQRNAK